MGSSAAMRSINEVIEAHGGEIREEWESQVPPALIPLFERVELSNEMYAIGVTWVFRDGSTLPGPYIDIDALADDYPDCHVGY